MEIFKFSVNHRSTEYYPDEEPFHSWMYEESWDNYLFNDSYVKEHKLVVVYTDVDMSISFAVTCPKEFVENNVPCLINNAEKYSKFIFDTDASEGMLHVRFLDYSEENIGVWYYEQEEDKFYRTYRDAEGRRIFCPPEIVC